MSQNLKVTMLVVLGQLRVRVETKTKHRGAAETIIISHNCSHKNDGEYLSSIFATHED